MATITGLTAERMQEIEDACIVAGGVVVDDLILTKHDGSTINAGNVRGPQGIQGIQGIQGPAWSPSVVTSLPGSPTDGQEVYLQTSAMATAQLIWHLRYRAAAAGSYKWEVLGGAPIYAKFVNGSGVAIATYDTFAEGLQLPAVPLAGKYILDMGFRIQHNVWPFEARLNLRNPANSAFMLSDGVWQVMSGASGYTRVSAVGSEDVTLTATGVYRAYFDYSSNSPVLHSFWAKLTPIALG